MPCHLCAERSEDYPKPAIFKTPFMAKAFPDFKPATDFLCPKCYSVYFRIIECKYGPRTQRTPTTPTSPTSASTSTSPRGAPSNAPEPSTSAAARPSTSARWRFNPPAVAPPEDDEAERIKATKRMREDM